MKVLWDQNTGVEISGDGTHTILIKDGYRMKYKTKYLMKLVDRMQKRFPEINRDKIMELIGQEILTDFMTKYLAAK